jgi:hypothetical protein
MWSQIFFPIGVTLFLANFFFILMNFLAIARRRLDQTAGARIFVAALLVPFYWILISIAAWKGFLQLLRPGKAHFWEKTQHGLSSSRHELPEAATAGGGARLDIEPSVVDDGAELHRPEDSNQPTVTER